MLADIASDLFSPLDSLEFALRQPEYLHAVLHSLPIWGVAFGLILISVGRFRSDESILKIGFCLLAIGSISVLPVRLLGEASVDHMEGLIDAAGREIMDRHAAAGKTTTWIALGAFALHTLTAFAWNKKRASSLRLTLLALNAATAMVLLIALASVAKLGGAIRHKEFRAGLQKNVEKESYD